MKSYTKKNLPLTKIRRFLEPGPVLMVSSAHRGERDIMTMGWHMVLGFEPALVGCFIWDENHSFSLIRRSKECVINIPTFDIVNTVIGVGNTHGGKVDKFEKFGLTPVDASKVDAPLIRECYANFECKLVDGSLINRYSLFIFGGEGSRGDVAALPHDSPPSGRWRVHGLRSKHQLPPSVQAREPVTDPQAFVAQAYAAFNERRLDDALSLMDPKVEWPNGMEGGTVYGHAGVRDYWTRQWALIDPHVEPCHITVDADGRIHVDVHQVVRDLHGTVLVDQMVEHVYTLKAGRIARIEIRSVADSASDKSSVRLQG